MTEVFTEIGVSVLAWFTVLSVGARLKGGFTLEVVDILVIVAAAEDNRW